MFVYIYSGNNTNQNLTDVVSVSAKHGGSQEWFEVVIPLVCVFGLFTNIMNLIVLARKRLLSQMDCLEKSPKYVLTTLAYSDMVVCLIN